MTVPHDSHLDEHSFLERDSYVEPCLECGTEHAKEDGADTPCAKCGCTQNELLEVYDEYEYEDLSHLFPPEK